MKSSKSVHPQKCFFIHFLFAIIQKKKKKEKKKKKSKWIHPEITPREFWGAKFIQFSIFGNQQFLLTKKKVNKQKQIKNKTKQKKNPPISN